MALGTNSNSLTKKWNYKEGKGDNKIMLSSDKGKYIIDGIGLERVTNWIHNYISEFDAYGAAIGAKRKANINGEDCLNPNKKVHYWNLNKERSMAYGTAVHLFSEMYDMDESTVPIFVKEYAIKKFIDDTKDRYFLIGNELKCFSKKYKLAGTIDRLLKDKETGKYIIMDWKTTFDIDKDYGKKMKEPFKQYKNSYRNHYELQLIVYKNLEHIEINGYIMDISADDIQEMWLVILKDDGTYVVEIVRNIDENIVIQELEKRCDYGEAINELL